MNPIGAYIRIAETYLSFVGDVLMLVLRVYWKVLEIMFVFLLGPGAARVVAALKQGENTFRLIIEDPVGFFGNLLGAIGKGIKQFGSNIWKHIQGGLIGWMLGSLQGAGIEMPEKFDLKGVVSIVMQLLGLTYRQIRPILVKRLGENVVAGLEATFEFLRLFLTEGFAGSLAAVPRMGWRFEGHRYSGRHRMGGHQDRYGRACPSSPLSGIPSAGPSKPSWRSTTP